MACGSSAAGTGRRDGAVGSVPSQRATSATGTPTPALRPPRYTARPGFPVPARRVDAMRAPAAALQCGNLVFGRQLADLGRDQAGALGQHARRAALRFVVPQRHGIVRGVGHHHVRLGHVGHHAAARGLALLLADARLDVRVALAFLVFLAHVFLGHAQLLQVAPDLPGHVQRDDHRQRGHDQRAADGDDGQRARQRRRRRHVHEAQHVVVVAPDHPDRHAAHQQGLGQRLDQLDHRLRGKHALEAGERAELGQIGLQRLARDHDPAQHHAGQHRDHGQQAEDRQQGHQRLAEALHGLFHHHARIQRHALVEGQAVAQHPAQAPVQRAAAQPDRRDAGGQHHERAQFRERAICPSSRAFSRRLGEAASVFSRSLSSAMLCGGVGARGFSGYELPAEILGGLAFSR